MAYPTRKRVTRPYAYFGILLNRETAGPTFARFRRFAFSPLPPSPLASSGQHWKPGTERFPDLFLDLVDMEQAIDHYDALRLADRELSIAAADAFIKLGGLLFHSIGFAWLTFHSPLSSRSVDVEHEGDIRDAISDCERVHPLNDFAIQLACRPLIYGCRIEEPIGNHAHATFECGLDYLAHQLAATGLKQKELSLGRHVRVMWSELQKVADTFADRRAAGFAGQKIRNIESLKMRGESVSLGGLSASF